MGNLPELIAQFQSAARFYFDRAFRNGRDLPDLQNEADTFAAMNRLVEVGKALAAELEKAGENSTELYRLLDAAFMRLEKGRYLAAWEPVRVSLARMATVVALTPPAAKQEQSEGNGKAGKTRNRKGIGGRKRLAPKEARKRETILADWQQAKGAGIRQKQFCRNQGISTCDLEKFVAWQSTKTRRKRTA